MTRALGLVGCILLLCSTAGAEIVTVDDTVNYLDNDWAGGPFFVPPGEILDHSPWHTIATEDWGWTHDLNALVPKDATAIQSASVTIVAWDVDAEEGERDGIYAILGGAPPARINLGLLNGYNVAPISVPWSAAGQVGNYENLWSTTSFDLPKDVLDELWKDGEISLFMDVDQSLDGFRVTLEHATLTVNYLTAGQIPEPATIGLLGLGGLFTLARRRR